MEDIEEKDMEQEDTRAEDEYADEGRLYHSLKEILDGFEKNGVLTRKSIVSVLEKLIGEDT